ncbi:MAG: hypothetical protein OHK0013_16050 [Sandaracinaceae bacterium]
MPLPPVFIALAAIALLLALVALWNSLRIAFGSPSDGAASSLAGDELPDRAALLDEKKSLLRAIKDLEYEHAVGKIGVEDFERLDRAYRLRAKEVLALLDKDLAPYQQRAEAVLSGVGARATVAQTPTDEEALRERARKLREEAERLERLASTKKDADAPEVATSGPKSDGEGEGGDG